MKGQLHSLLKDCRKAGAVAWMHRKKLAFVPAVMLMASPVMQAHAQDLFSSGKETIRDTFGTNSTTVWILYVLEVLFAIFTYIKTKNLALFGGIAALLVFANVAFGLLT
ncbi:type IV conjugative transfer system pilin TraA [Candidatus Pantoea multigeneris]|uniref:Pilin n=1 Tax=Candidatus Pantoea multigeneris TaxID=2608357 RepID=A0ABX0REY0_9GAMM|nr:type IV conjugative transfer system pilin TraA [Pantoea multigeneris]NIF23910.1 TraA fimbrial protein precursor [Pantoea multigeneris]